MDVPITKQRNPEKYDKPEVFEGTLWSSPLSCTAVAHDHRRFYQQTKELVTDLIVKTKQVEYVIKSLPEPEPEEEQAKRLQVLDDVCNEEYIQAVARSKDLHAQIADVLRLMLGETDSGPV
ncbi:hypothetical protein B0H19DRAFT_968143 [Mycena capillaripes]|nr:hypothetical protein B0H19DRAFT_968143 [Mycena capillaripes]